MKLWGIYSYSDPTRYYSAFYIPAFGRGAVTTAFLVFGMAQPWSTHEVNFRVTTKKNTIKIVSEFILINGVYFRDLIVLRGFPLKTKAVGDTFHILF